MKWTVEVDLPDRAESDASDEETAKILKAAVNAVFGGWASVRVTKPEQTKEATTMKKLVMTFVMFMVAAGGQQKKPPRPPQECTFKEVWIIDKQCQIIVDTCGKQTMKGNCPTYVPGGDLGPVVVLSLGQ